MTPARLARLDRRHSWHPFTQMRDWMRSDPVLITGGRGAVLEDTLGRRYLDANASIWTNLHGHRHPAMDRAVRRQLGKVAHTSSLGLANEPSTLLAGRLVAAARGPGGGPRAERVFFSDDGSTAVEAALKLSYEHARRTGPGGLRPRFLSLDGAYHGDTIGAVSLGHIDLFHRAFGGLLFRADRVMAPYCYRCPYNRAAPARADARQTRQCGWECVDRVAAKFEQARRAKRPYTAWVVEPRLQGAAGMIPQPEGWFRRTAEIARAQGAHVIADEVMTGFGRTGVGPRGQGWLFASQHEGVRPDFTALAKGLTGGYLPLAATLATADVFNAFLGEYADFKTFFHGHSYTGNQLGSAAALASLDLLEAPGAAARRGRLQSWLADDLATLWDSPWVGDIRQVGLVAGIELVRDWTRRTPFPLAERAGARVCEAMTRRGVLTRPIGAVVVLMPPYCTTRSQLRRMVETLRDALGEVLGKTPAAPRRERKPRA